MDDKNLSYSNQCCNGNDFLEGVHKTVSCGKTNKLKLQSLINGYGHYAVSLLTIR